MRQVEPLFNAQARRNLSENEIALNQAMMEVWRLKKDIKSIVEQNKLLQQENELLQKLIKIKEAQIEQS